MDNNINNQVSLYSPVEEESSINFVPDSEKKLTHEHLVEIATLAAKAVVILMYRNFIKR
jgi:hypothetical protein